MNVRGPISYCEAVVTNGYFKLRSSLCYPLMNTPVHLFMLLHLYLYLYLSIYVAI